MITENSIQTIKSGRYFIIGKVDGEVQNLWIVFHGYGQLADEFIENFKILENKNTLIIAPEALNKFYFRGFTGKIGASWMTKKDRENEITDYVNFIDNVYLKVTKKIDLEKCKVNVLGFSQGTHTAVRWLDRVKIRINNLFLWSGSFPHDCDYKGNIDYWSMINKTIIVGNNDKMINKVKLQDEMNYLEKLNFGIEIITFDGGHEINQAILKNLSD